MNIFKVLALVLLIAVILGSLFKGALWIEKHMNENISSLKSDIPKAYLSLLNLDLDYVGHSKTIFADSIPAISSFEYDNRISIVASVLSNRSKAPMSNVVNCYNDLTNLGIDGGVVYSGIENDLVKFSYTPNGISTIFETLDVHCAKSNLCEELVTNDSISAYFIENSYGFKIKFNQRQYYDITVEVQPRGLFEKTDKNNAAVSNMLLLIRRHFGSLYIFLIHKKDDASEEIDKNILRTFNIKN
jgi:hypothetical protein